MSSDNFVPVIDVAPYFSGAPDGKRRVADQLGRACREVGFYVIVGHGVDPALVDEVEAVSREFFDLPIDEKMQLHVGSAPGAVGYAAIGDTALAYTRGQVAPPDLNESFQVAKVDVADDPYFQSDAARGLIGRQVVSIRLRLICLLGEALQSQGLCVAHLRAHALPDAAVFYRCCSHRFSLFFKSVT